MEAGLCESCAHSRKVAGAHTVFWMCERSRKDPTFPRYPRLPVLSCRGYEGKEAPVTPGPSA